MLNGRGTVQYPSSPLEFPVYDNPAGAVGVDNVRDPAPSKLFVMVMPVADPEIVSILLPVVGLVSKKAEPSIMALDEYTPLRPLSVNIGVVVCDPGLAVIKY